VDPISALISLFLGWIPFPQEEEGLLHIEQAPAEFFRKWDAAERARDGNGLLELYLLAREKLGRKLAPSCPGCWIPLPRHLQQRLVRLPPALLAPHEALARDRLRSRTDRPGRLEEAEAFLHTRFAQQVLGALAAEALDEGRPEDAARAGLRLLEIRPDPVLTARTARALALLGERPLLDPVDPDALVLVGGRPASLGAFLGSLLPPPRPEPGPPPPGPAVPRAGSPAEILLGVYDLRLDGGAFARHQAVSFPACAVLDGRSYVVFTNGVRVTALDPWRGEGDSLEGAVLWRFPASEEPLREIPTAYESPRNPQPLFGVEISGGRVFATMFSRERRGRLHGRRPDRFDGPAALRAFDLRTGRLLWDTDELRTEVDGESLPLLESLGLDQKNFAFAGPPVVRGERVFAAVMTTPNSERECHLLCLNAVDGHLLWFTSVASAYRPGWATSIPSFIEEGGRLYVQSNFGVVACLEAETGAMEWLFQYGGPGSRSSISPPVLAGGRVLFLPQDRSDPLCLDRRTGREAPLPPLSTPVAWWRILFLAPGEGGWFAAIGSPSLAVHTVEGTVVPLAGAEEGRPWRPFPGGRRLHVPLDGGLATYDTKTWSRIDLVRWPAEGLWGNFLAAEGLGVLLSDRLAVTTSAATLRDRYRARTEVSPPRADACLQAGRILERSGRPAEAAAYYRLADPAPEGR